ncbi:hypothetical protein DVH24_004333 [Malus domestica]|uniref:Uncharacterized protein n=1 Tax=Malus domestica TaxID=3750 RepID=A0A498K837_MALDO|nr:hypothetical protein DVH24_004333 [Malus domestica]
MLRLITRRRSVTAIQSKQMRAQGEEMKAYAGHMRDLVRAIQMSDLQILLPVPDLATLSTSEPLHPADAQ